jgi:hypothetical protein
MIDADGLKSVAARALELANQTSDPNVRAALIDFGTKCALQVPAGTEAQRRLDGALQEFNARQMFGPHADADALEVDEFRDE